MLNSRAAAPVHPILCMCVVILQYCLLRQSRTSWTKFHQVLLKNAEQMKDTVDVQGEMEVLRVRAAPSTLGQAEANTIVHWSGLCHGLDLR